MSKINKLSETQRLALELANKHNGLRRYKGSIYWIGADIDQNKVKSPRLDNYPMDTPCVGTHSVKALERLGLLAIEGDTATLVRCDWCSATNKFECRVFDNDGKFITAVEAEFCPKCGRWLFETEEVAGR